MQTHLSSCSEKNCSKNGCVLLIILIGLLVVALVVAAAVACGLAPKGLEIKKKAKRNLNSNSRIDATPLQCFPQRQGDNQAKSMRLPYLTVACFGSIGILEVRSLPKSQVEWQKKRVPTWYLPLPEAPLVPYEDGFWG